MKTTYTSNGSLSEIEFDEKNSKDILEKTTSIRQFILSKFLSSNNLNFLLSNGCSICANSKPINSIPKGADYQKIISDFGFTTKRFEDLTTKINSLDKERPEVALDKIFEIRSIIDKIYEDKEALVEIEKLIEDVKKSFLEEFVLTIDYSKNIVHKLFLKKITSRDSKLDKANFFTLNYDLLIEKSAEQLGLYVNNGFWGFHDRFFMPSAYQIDIHLKSAEGGKHIKSGIRLYKLHGSLSWFSDYSKPPYAIAEKQLNINASNTIEYSEIKSNLIIYPIQSKKKYSLDLPYSELFRHFVERLNSRDSTLIIIGYGFQDEHVNDVIMNALANPDFNLVVFSFLSSDDSDSQFFKDIFEFSKSDKRITVFSGQYFGNFEFITKFLLPYSDEKDPKEVFFKTFLELQKLTPND